MEVRGKTIFCCVDVFENNLVALTAANLVAVCVLDPARVHVDFLNARKLPFFTAFPPEVRRSGFLQRHVGSCRPDPHSHRFNIGRAALLLHRSIRFWFWLWRRCGPLNRVGEATVFFQGFRVELPEASCGLRHIVFVKIFPETLRDVRLSPRARHRSARHRHPADAQRHCADYRGNTAPPAVFLRVWSFILAHLWPPYQ